MVDRRYKIFIFIPSIDVNKKEIAQQFWPQNKRTALSIMFDKLRVSQ